MSVTEFGTVSGFGSRRACTVLWVVVVLVLGLSSVYAQDNTGNDPFGVIIYAEGTEVGIFRGDELATYDVVFDPVVGMEVMEGDLIQTDDGTFLEIQLFPSRDVVSVAENTTFQVERIGTSGGSFTLNYGRLRARVQRVTGTTPFEIRGSEAVAGVRGTDFGYDFVATRDEVGAPVTQVYVFEGSVLVAEAGADLNEVEIEEESETTDPEAPELSDTSESTETPGSTETPATSDEQDGETAAPATVAGPAPRRAIVLRASEMATVARVPATQEPDDEPETPRPGDLTIVFQTDPIREDINRYWEANTFTEEALEVEEAIEAFPDLSERFAALTATPPTEPPEDVPPVEEVPPTEETDPQGEGQPDEEGDDLPVLREVPAETEVVEDPEPQLTPQERAVAAGAILGGVGSVVEIGGLLLTVFGDAVFPDASDTMLQTTSTAMVISGGAFLLGGLISFLLSFAE